MKFYKPNNITVLTLNSSYNCKKSNSLSMALTSAGSGYTNLSKLIVTPDEGDNGYGFSANVTIGGGVPNGIYGQIGGNGYNVLPIVYLNDAGGLIHGTIIGYTSLVGGTGYTTAPNITFTGGGYTKIATATCTVSAGVVTTITITDAGEGYTSLPTIGFTPTNGGSGASATATSRLLAVITPSFARTYEYNFNIPDIVLNDLGKLSLLNVVATGYTAATPYTIRVKNILFNNRDAYYSDYGAPILGIVQQTNICNGTGGVGKDALSILLPPQIINKITIVVDDDIANTNSGCLATIKFVFTLLLEEYDPVLTEVGNPYNESARNQGIIHPKLV